MKTPRLLPCAALVLVAAVLACGPAKAEPAAKEAEPMTLTMDQALEMASGQNPETAAAEARVDRAKGEYGQTRLWSNPQLEVGAEGVTPDGERSSGSSERPNQQQTLVSVKQPLPIAGGRTGQQKSARQEIEYQEYMHAATLLGVRTQVKKAFVDVLFSQQTLQTLQEMAGRLQQIVTITKARFDSGDIAESELLRAEANHSRFLLEVTAAQESLDTAHIALAQAIGRPELRIGECLGALEVSPPQIDWAAMESRLAENPSAAALVAKSKKARLDVRTEEARRFPSPVVGVGYRHYQETGQDTFDVGLGIELPIFDRRQGSVAAAEANAREAEALSRHNANQLRSAVLKLRKRQEYLVRELDEFRNAILPKMTECLAVSQSAFDAGGNSMIEVLDAYKALAETRLSFLEKTRDYAGLLISLEELTSQECFKP